MLIPDLIALLEGTCWLTCWHYINGLLQGTCYRKPLHLIGKSIVFCSFPSTSFNQSSGYRIFLPGGSLSNALPDCQGLIDEACRAWVPQWKTPVHGVSRIGPFTWCPWFWLQIPLLNLFSTKEWKDSSEIGWIKLDHLNQSMTSKCGAISSGRLWWHSDLGTEKKSGSLEFEDVFIAKGLLSVAK